MINVVCLHGFSNPALDTKFWTGCSVGPSQCFSILSTWRQSCGILLLRVGCIGAHVNAHTVMIFIHITGLLRTLNLTVLNISRASSKWRVTVEEILRLDLAIPLLSKCSKKQMWRKISSSNNLTKIQQHSTMRCNDESGVDKMPLQLLRFVQKYSCSYIQTMTADGLRNTFPRALRHYRHLTGSL